MRILWIIVLTLIAGVAFAQDGAQQFSAGQEKFAAGDLEGALVEFRKAVELSNSPNARLYVARCLKDLNRLPEAWEELRITVREAGARADAEPKYTKTRDAAAAMLAIVDPLVARVVLAVSDDDVESISLNGQPIDKSSWGQPVAVPPGPVGVLARAPGRDDLTLQAQASAGRAVTISVLWPRTAAPEPSDTPAPAAGSPDDGDGGGGLRIAGYAVAGLGVAGFAVFAVTGLMVLDRESELDAACGGSNCTDPMFDDTISEGETLQIVANIGLGVGIAGVVAGTLMIIFGGADSQESMSLQQNRLTWSF